MTEPIEIPGWRHNPQDDCYERVLDPETGHVERWWPDARDLRRHLERSASAHATGSSPATPPSPDPDEGLGLGDDEGAWATRP